MKIILIIIGSILLLIALVFAITSKTRGLAREFITQFTSGKLTESYAMLADNIQRDIPFAEFSAIYTDRADFLTQVDKITLRNVSTETSTETGTTSTATGFLQNNSKLRVPLVIHMTKVDQVWKVVGFNMDFDNAVQK
jgi:hypothetical protein